MKKVLKTMGVLGLSIFALSACTNSNTNTNTISTSIIEESKTEEIETTAVIDDSKYQVSKENLAKALNTYEINNFVATTTSYTNERLNGTSKSYKNGNYLKMETNLVYPEKSEQTIYGYLETDKLTEFTYSDDVWNKEVTEISYIKQEQIKTIDSIIYDETTHSYKMENSSTMGEGTEYESTATISLEYFFENNKLIKYISITAITYKNNPEQNINGMKTITEFEYDKAPEIIFPDEVLNLLK